MQVHYINTTTGLNGDSVRQVMAIGDFDGVHKGHQEVIRRAVTTAARLGIEPSVMTFHPHPRVVLGQQQYIRLLTPLEEKLRLLERIGVTHTYIVRFDPMFAEVPPERFVEDYLVPLGLETAIVGFDFRFGHRGTGTADTLGMLGGGRFAVEIVRPYHQDGSKVSSSRIRECLEQGELSQANALLGRPYALRGQVVTGEGRGRTIGFPTANIEPTDAYVLPARGVYAVQVMLGNERLNGVMNIGLKPTFASEDPKTTLEVHLFDFNRSIYGDSASVRFLHYIRPEHKFGSVDELVAQIERDSETARSLLPAAQV